MNYKEQIKHPKWQRKRLEILQRDNFKCRCCNDEDTQLHIHHKKYISGNKIWMYADDDLITLCEDCHILIEAITKEFKIDYNVLNGYKKKHNKDAISLFIKCKNHYVSIMFKSKDDTMMHGFNEDEFSLFIQICM
jgi:5-methylcytosine-specific restriction endonuclease McrA